MKGMEQWQALWTQLAAVGGRASALGAGKHKE